MSLEEGPPCPDPRHAPARPCPVWAASLPFSPWSGGSRPSRRTPPPPRAPTRPATTTASASATTSCRRARTATPPSSTIPGVADARTHPGPLQRPARQVRRPAQRVHRPDDDQIGNFYNDSSFGVPTSQVESSESPRSDVTIVRDKATGVPARDRHDARRHRVRRGLRRRRGPAVPDGPAAARRPRPADQLRRRRGRQPGAGTERVAQFAVPGKRSSSSGGTRSRPRGPRGAQLYTDVQKLRGRHQRLHRPLHGPAPGQLPG